MLLRNIIKCPPPLFYLFIYFFWLEIATYSFIKEGPERALIDLDRILAAKGIVGGAVWW